FLMSKRFRLFVIILLLIPSLSKAQQKDTLIKKLDSLSKKTDSTGGKQINNTNPETYNENTKITVHSYLVLTADDIEQQVSSPLRAKSKTWLEVGGFGLLTTGCVLFGDKPVNRLAVDIRNQSKTVVSTSLYVTNFGGLYEAYT